MWAFEYLETASQELQVDYSYTAVTGSCQYDASKGKVNVTSHTLVEPNSVDALKAAIAVQPVAVSVEADKPVFRNYVSGVMNSAECGIATNHAIVAVGYGTDATGKDYYIVRNSWSASWGDQGYIKIGVESGIGICAIQKMPVYPKTD